MTRQAQVGAFAIIALLLLFGVFYVITDFGTRHTGYRVGVHFESAAGLTSGALVYFSGVNVGSVDSITLLPDNTVDVILAVNKDIDIPGGIEILDSGALDRLAERDHRSAAYRRSVARARRPSGRSAAAGSEQRDDRRPAPRGPGRNQAPGYDARADGAAHAQTPRHAADDAEQRERLNADR